MTLKREYYLTDGLKFGSDFLIYKGDPMLFHAEYLLKVIDSGSMISIKDMILYERMANTNKKHLIIAF